MSRNNPEGFLHAIANQWGMASTNSDNQIHIQMANGETLDISLKAKNAHPDLHGCYNLNSRDIKVNALHLSSITEERVQLEQGMRRLGLERADIQKKLNAFDEIVSGYIGALLVHEGCHAKQHAELANDGDKFWSWHGQMEQAAYFEQSQAALGWLAAKGEAIERSGLLSLGGGDEQLENAVSHSQKRLHQLLHAGDRFALYAKNDEIGGPGKCQTELAAIDTQKQQPDGITQSNLDIMKATSGPSVRPAAGLEHPA